MLAEGDFHPFPHVAPFDQVVASYQRAMRQQEPVAAAFRRGDELFAQGVVGKRGDRQGKVVRTLKDRGTAGARVVRMGHFHHQIGSPRGEILHPIEHMAWLDAIEPVAAAVVHEGDLKAEAGLLLYAPIDARADESESDESDAFHVCLFSEGIRDATSAPQPVRLRLS